MTSLGEESGEGSVACPLMCELSPWTFVDAAASVALIGYAAVLQVKRRRELRFTSIRVAVGCVLLTRLATHVIARRLPTESSRQTSLVVLAGVILLLVLGATIQWCTNTVLTALKVTKLIRAKREHQWVLQAAKLAQVVNVATVVSLVGATLGASAPECTRLFVGVRVYSLLTFYVIGAIVMFAHYKLIREIAGIVAKHAQTKARKARRTLQASTALLVATGTALLIGTALEAERVVASNLEGMTCHDAEVAIVEITRWLWCLTLLHHTDAKRSINDLSLKVAIQSWLGRSKNDADKQEHTFDASKMNVGVDPSRSDYPPGTPTPTTNAGEGADTPLSKADLRTRLNTLTPGAGPPSSLSNSSVRRHGHRRNNTHTTISSARPGSRHKRTRTYLNGPVRLYTCPLDQMAPRTTRSPRVMPTRAHTDVGGAGGGNNSLALEMSQTLHAYFSRAESLPTSVSVGGGPRFATVGHERLSSTSQFSDYGPPLYSLSSASIYGNSPAGSPNLGSVDPAPRPPARKPRHVLPQRAHTDVLPQISHAAGTVSAASSGSSSVNSRTSLMNLRPLSQSATGHPSGQIDSQERRALSDVEHSKQSVLSESESSSLPEIGTDRLDLDSGLRAPEPSFASERSKSFSTAADSAPFSYSHSSFCEDISTSGASSDLSAKLGDEASRSTSTRRSPAAAPAAPVGSANAHSAQGPKSPNKPHLLRSMSSVRNFLSNLKIPSPTSKKSARTPVSPYARSSAKSDPRNDFGKSATARSGVGNSKRGSSPLQLIKRNNAKPSVGIPRQHSLKSVSSVPGTTSAVPRKHLLKPASSVPVTVTVEPSPPPSPPLGAEVRIAVIPISSDFSLSEEASASPPSSS